MGSEEHPGIVTYRAERERYSDFYKLSQQIEDPEIRLSGRLAKFVSDARTRIVRAHEEGRPFINNNYCTAPEVTEAMDIPWFMLYEAPFMAVSAEGLSEQIDETAAMGLGVDLCTAIRSSIYYVEKDLVPVPSAVIGFIFPCDGMPMLHQVIKHSKSWGHVPMFCPDPPYFNDDRSIDYFANELRKMTAFLEEVTGKRLDMDRLVAVVEESDRQYLLWQEYNELRRAVPCPHGFGLGGPMCFAVSQLFKVGHQEGTQWFQSLVDLTEDKVKKGIGAVKKEKVRLFWFDIMPSGWIFEFMPWLEEEFGAVVVMDMFGNHPYSTIDTSDEKEIWRGLAKRGLFDTPMVRQAMGPAEGFVNDLVRIVKDYQIDVVVWPGHMGHKETQGTFGIMQEACREIGVPFLDIRMDIFDRRYTTADQIKDKFTRFFRGMGLA
jgi:benzoyl-CoA reductase/2-hydroxyglutaryl-CoA dehydratase subunit BcrC/BadD/HgdB